jgi:hypothetical protein
MFILLLRGFSQSGKDFIGNIICEQYGYRRFAFADSLKKIVSRTYSIPMSQLYSQDGKMEICLNDPLKRTIRQLLIDTALEIRKEQNNYFAMDCCQDIQQQQIRNIVITDWRFTIELETLQQFFPDASILPIHIRRMNQTESPVYDSSEYELQHRQDYIIDNDMNDSIYEEIKKCMTYHSIK